MKPKTLPCTREDISTALAELWPIMAARHGIDARDDLAPGPLLDGHMGVGFSIRMFGPPTSEPQPNDRTRAAYAALEDVLRAMEDMGFEVTRDGNQWQEGRLVLGWAAFVRAYDVELLRFRDVADVHGANVERRERLRLERAIRDEPRK